MNYPDIYVLRHGQTEWNLAGRHQGRLDSPLTELGRAQAADQGRILSGLALDWSSVAFVSSPQGRALSTAKIVGDPFGCSLTQDARLVEISFGSCEGMTEDEIAAVFPAFADDGGDPIDRHFYVPGGESFEELSARAQSFLDDLDRPTVVVTHGITSRVLRSLAMGGGRPLTLDLPGGQGVVHAVCGGKHRTLNL